MPEVSATDAARSFSDILDAVEHRGEHFTIVRRGKVVARIDPVSTGKGREVKAMLRRHKPDVDLATELVAVRRLLEIERRP